MVLLISEADISSVVDQKAAVDRMELAFRELAGGRAIAPSRFTVQIPQSFGSFRLMPSVMLGPDDKRASGFKLLAGTAGHRQDGRLYFLIALLDYEDGSVRCLMSANLLTRIRTGAASALATRYLARKDSRSFGLVGAGVQGRGQLEAICATAKPSVVLVYDRSKEKAEKLADLARTSLGAGEARAVDSLDEAAGADIVSTATTSAIPILSVANVRRGTHVNAIGSNVPARRELSVDLLKASKVVVDLKEQAVQESGDLEPVRRNELPASTVYAELGQVVSGLRPGRDGPEDITIFKSVGIALQDIAMAQLVYERAVAKGIGTEVRF
jgi:alanine dehydrogenase